MKDEMQGGATKAMQSIAEEFQRRSSPFSRVRPPSVSATLLQKKKEGAANRTLFHESSRLEPRTASYQL